MFKFCEAPPKMEEDIFYAIISGKFCDEMELLYELQTILDLPWYFGKNWDALFECLRDFHWINNYKIVIYHKVLPNLPLGDMHIYLGILYDAIIFWNHDPEHSLEVIFNSSDKNFIINMLPVKSATNSSSQLV